MPHSNSTYFLLALIASSSFYVAHSYMDDQLERKLSLYDLLTNQNGYMPYLKKNDPSWRYIGLGKRSDHEERFIKRLPPNRYAMIGLGR
ncbi:hypothetical protein Tcan_02607 [Toxocara canis]|uniref:Uncharacterized protein n=1 Tax=Toxocara canis TaxID=6265 RepID=A0A0B2VSN4_TOXCA|nr:hypothetical protein Tcan_02607 [Toxocara canis]